MEDQIKTSAQRRRMIPARIGRDAQRYGILIALALLCIVLLIISENFLTTRNVINVLCQTSINSILAIGMTFVILTGSDDVTAPDGISMPRWVFNDLQRGAVTSSEPTEGGNQMTTKMMMTASALALGLGLGAAQAQDDPIKIGMAAYGLNAEFMHL